MNAVDTNVLIYACDGRDQAKQATALRLLDDVRDMVLMWQVALEFIAASRKLAGTGFSADQAWARLDEFCAVLPLVPPSPGALVHCRKIQLNSGVSFWDAALLGACLDAGIHTLYSEDLPGGDIEGVRIVNPFA